MASIDRDDAEAFIKRWHGVAASELSTSQSFLIDLCALLGVGAPHPDAEQQYMFERPIVFSHGDGTRSAGRIDLYRRGAFVLESKKVKAGAHTRGFDEAMLRARSQAEAYARALPAAEGRPPFVMVVDVGHRIELYAEFSRSGGTYVPFPDPRSHRIALADLRDPVIRERLRTIWTDPLSLDPSRRAAQVTREIAAKLATLAKSLERAGHAPESVAQFLMRCLFTMFAEDVRLLPRDSFRDLLAQHAAQPDVAMRMLGQLWRDMNDGGFSAVLAGDVLRFNGKLYKIPDTLPLDREQILLLLEAAKADWKHVEPAIFGTLLERALSPDERHKLGAHYTPRAYVERLVLPTVIEPLREEWSNAQAAAMTLEAEGKHDEAVAALRAFHHRLCNVRVLDPACGSGNFLYVTLEHLKRLEGEVLNALDALGFTQTGLALGGERADAMGGETVDPHNLLGIEINPRAAAIAEVVLWIGYLQWHFRTRGNVSPPQPVIRDFRNIENRDAVLAYDAIEYATDERGSPVTRWDGKSMKVSPVTGEMIPAEEMRVPLERYVNPRKAEWPEADFVVGNPPFIGNKRMRVALGDGYVEALRASWSSVPDSADFVMYWWECAASLTAVGSLQRFGLITTNSIRQPFNRRVLGAYVEGTSKALRLAFAIPDHPWVDSSEGADVRIAMTVATESTSEEDGRLLIVTDERQADEGEFDLDFSVRSGLILPDLSIGPNVVGSSRLLSNGQLCGQGIKVVGDAFFVPSGQFGEALNPATKRPVVRKYATPKMITHGQPAKSVIDFFALDEADARTICPAAYQHLLHHIKPHRDHNARDSIRVLWWKFGWDRPVFRAATSGLARYIVTLETSKHRFFSFVPSDLLCDGSLFWVALSESHLLGVLSSSVHLVWALRAGSRLGVGNDPRYNRAVCFDAFPFPVLSPHHARRIGEVADAIESHRATKLGTHKSLNMTMLYNVLDKLRTGVALSPKEREVHELGLVSILRQLHDELDELVVEAYGWTDLVPLLRQKNARDAVAHGHTREELAHQFDEQVLGRLVALNAERALEESRGLVRWLRPDFQNPSTRDAVPAQGQIAVEPDDEAAAGVSAASAAAKPRPWPKDAVEQVRAVAHALEASAGPLSLDDIAARFTARGPWKRRLPQLLDMLVALGRAREQGGRYTPATR